MSKDEEKQSKEPTYHEIRDKVNKALYMADNWFGGVIDIHFTSEELNKILYIMNIVIGE